MNRHRFVPMCAIALAVCVAGSAWGATSDREHPEFKNILQAPNTQMKSHTWGNMKLVVTNWGFFGNAEQYDQYVWSCEFPANSHQDYLFQGALWIGGVVDEDTMVSVGADGWLRENEMFPGPNDSIMERSINPASPYYWDPADSSDPLFLEYGPTISEQDFIAVYTDTVGNPYTPPDHRPLGIVMTQQTYCWSYDYAQDFILMKYWIENIRGDGKTVLELRLKDRGFNYSLAELMQGSRVELMAGWNEQKVKFYQPVSESQYFQSFTFTDTAARGCGRDFYYVRVTQANGQMAWSSPVWVEGK